jgi:3-hydroxyisobutyrate dehydrogenase-like beta-hydroxyacid dehydrogenase
MCDFIQIFVSDDEALLDVCKQLAPTLAPRHIVIAHSTVSPQAMREAAEMVERRGARFVEAPFTGSKKAAETGELFFYVGGDEMAIEEARPILNASAKNIMVIGEIGQATAIKLATNMITAASVQAAAEALALVHTAGLPLEKLAEAMEGNASYSKTLAMKFPKMIQTSFDPHFSVKHMLKDIQIANSLGSEYHLELGVAAATRDRLAEQMQHGYGEEDYSAVARKYFAFVRAPEPEPEKPVIEAIEQPPQLTQQQQPAQEQPQQPQEQVAASAPQDISAFLQALQAAQQQATGQPSAPVPEQVSEPQPPHSPQSHVHSSVAAVAEFTPIGVQSDRHPNSGAASGPVGRTASKEPRDESSAEDAEERRGFLSRLLRRQIDY